MYNSAVRRQSKDEPTSADVLNSGNFWRKKKEVPEYLQIKKFSLFSFFFNKKKKENEEKEDENGQLETV